MVKCICPACNFKCDVNEIGECPYCGKGRLEKEKNAEELLEEVNRMLEE